jgi:hypothetical protein
VHHADGSSTPHLLDFGQMAKNDDENKVVSYNFCIVTIDFETDDPSLFKVYKNNGVPANKQNVRGYALHRAEAIYPLKP